MSSSESTNSFNAREFGDTKDTTNKFVQGRKDYKGNKDGKNSKKMSNEVKTLLIVVGVVVAVMLIGLIAWTAVSNTQRRITNMYMKNIQNPLQPLLDSHTETIFVSIPSSCDSETAELVPTILDCFSKAAQPGRVFVGVCYQRRDASAVSAEDDFWTTFHKQSKRAVSNGMPQSMVDECQNRISVVTISASAATGPTLLRQLIETKLLLSQKYVFMIDNCTAFSFGWDSQLVSDLNHCHTVYKDPNAVLSCAPSKFDINERQQNALPGLLHKLYKRHPNLFRINEFKTFQLSIEARHRLWTQFAKRVDPPRPTRALQFSQFLPPSTSYRHMPVFQAATTPDFDVTESELRVKPFVDHFQPDNETTLSGNHNINLNNYLQPNKRQLQDRNDRDSDLKRYSKNLPMRSLFWTPRCSFALAKVHKHVKYMSLPYLSIGEDISMAAMLWTHGYNFYTPSVEPVRNKHDLQYQWSPLDEIPQNRDGPEDATKFQTRERSYALLRRFLRVEPRLGSDSNVLAKNNLKIGQDRTLQDFFLYVGLDLVKHTASPDAKAGIPKNLSMQEQLQRLGYASDSKVENSQKDDNINDSVDAVNDFTFL